jgi:hypothetical protein
MEKIVCFLNSIGFAGNNRNDLEMEPNVIFIQDFYSENKRVTIVELVDKYQVMIYDGKNIHQSNQDSLKGVLNYLKGKL